MIFNIVPTHNNVSPIGIRFWRLVVSLGLILGIFASVSLWTENRSLNREVDVLNNRADTLLRTLDTNYRIRTQEIGRLEHDLRDALEVNPTAADLVAMRADIDAEIVDTQTNIDRLRSVVNAVPKTIALAEKSVIYLQTSFRLIDDASGKPLKHYVTATAKLPIYLPNGSPFIGIDGNGPVFEPIITGTGFVSNEGIIVTNRHVAQPWETGPYSAFLSIDGIHPELVRVRGYAPDIIESFVVEIVQVAMDYDLALLESTTRDLTDRALELQDSPVVAGESVVLLGYPYGLQALMARSGKQYAEYLQSTDYLNQWTIADRLSTDGMIFPLASSGIVARVTRSAVVYDAATGSGGSGGPVMSLDNKVIAVNSAVLQGFGGSNIGIPAADVMQLFQDYREFAD